MPSTPCEPHAHNKRVLVVSRDAGLADDLSQQVTEAAYHAETLDGLDSLRHALAASECLAVFLDLDSISLDNATVRALVCLHHRISFFGISRLHVHPNLQEAISHHLQACLSAPVDSDELRFWLRSAADLLTSSRGPPTPDPL